MAGNKQDKTPNVDWNSILNKFSGGGGTVLFLKGKTRCRFLPFEDPDKIFMPVDSIFRGNVRTKYIVKIWHLDAEEGQPRIRALLLSKRDIRGILQLQVEGWDLFDPKTGHAVALIKSGSGTNTSVNVSPSPKPVPIPQDVLDEADEMDLEEEARQFTANQHRRNESGEDTEDEAAGGESGDEDNSF